MATNRDTCITNNALYLAITGVFFALLDEWPWYIETARYHVYSVVHSAPYPRLARMLLLGVVDSGHNHTSHPLYPHFTWRVWCAQWIACGLDWLEIEENVTVLLSSREIFIDNWIHRERARIWNTSAWYLTIEAETKWTPFRRRHFQTHFLEWKYPNFE